jgi:hypothetical protein
MADSMRPARYASLKPACALPTTVQVHSAKQTVAQSGEVTDYRPKHAGPAFPPVADREILLGLMDTSHPRNSAPVYKIC